MALSPRTKAARKLVRYALDELYVFDEDWIEDELDKSLLKYRGRRDWRKQVRAHLMSKPKVREAITKIACEMFDVEIKK